jgi:hypothetical protein
MKYIKFKNIGFVVFEETQSHAGVARSLCDEVESAGYVRAAEWCDKGRVCCSGASITLNKQSSPTDTHLLRATLERHG